ncbi:MAG: hypothetical protein MZW92_67995 [Comamonadaceae bacterium]|nr:hypothetical protein [Comamonadaceae bacterium]
MRALLRRPGDAAATRYRDELDAHPDEGRDAQPPDRDLAVPRRGHRLGRRDPRRGRHRPRRQAQGRPVRLLGVEPAHPRARRSRGKRDLRQARAHRLARSQIMIEGPIGARGLQQRVRPAQPRRLLPHLRAGGGRRACAATTSRS